jgi:endonuclease-3
MYKSVQEAIAGELPKGAAALSRAHLLLRQHGKTLCRDAKPECFECPLSKECAFGLRCT